MLYSCTRQRTSQTYSWVVAFLYAFPYRDQVWIGPSRINPSFPNYTKETCICKLFKTLNQSQLKSSSPSLFFPLSFPLPPTAVLPGACPFSIRLSSNDSLVPTNEFPLPTSPFEAPASNSSLANSASRSASVVGCAICVAFERDVRGNA